MSPVARVVVGARGEARTLVTPDVTVRHFHADMPAVYGTPFMIYLMEVAAANAVRDALPAGWVTVGFEVHVRHLAATPVGREVVARAEVTAVEGKRIHYTVDAHDGVQTIGSGKHTRVAVDLRSFENSTGAALHPARR